MKYLYFLIVLFVVSACSSVKQSQRALNSGNYDESIKIAVEHLRKSKTRKSNLPYIGVLQTAFQKATQRDLERITFLEGENNRANCEEIYKLYEKLYDRQELIKPLLPLANASFKFKNYMSEMVEAKTNVANYLYEQALPIFDSNTKQGYRDAYGYYQKIEKLFPDFKDVRARMQEAHYKGRDFVLVSLYNETDKVIPHRLEEDLLDFSAYGLNDFWTVYDGQEDKNTHYDFGLELVFREIKVTPEHIREREIIKEKQLKDGFVYVKDSNGNILTDTLGNKLKKDRYITVSCKFYESNQHKECRMLAKINYVDFSRNTIINSFPIDSHFVFENSYGKMSGDKRALNDKLLKISRHRHMPFPSNEQMIFDAGMDLKGKFKTIIMRNHFR